PRPDRDARVRLPVRRSRCLLLRHICSTGSHTPTGAMYTTRRSAHPPIFAISASFPDQAKVRMYHLFSVPVSGADSHRATDEAAVAPETALSSNARFSRYFRKRSDSAPIRRNLCTAIPVAEVFFHHTVDSGLVA